MYRSTQNEIRTQGIVLRRTNYAEADRILNLVTPEGKVVAIARGVRRAKSKLAGGVEMFMLSDYRIHTGKSEMGVVTSARMVKYYGEIVRDYARMNLAAEVLRRVGRMVEGAPATEYFVVAREVLEALNARVRMEMVESFAWINLLKASGEEINLYRDVSGEKLRADERYEWDAGEGAFVLRDGGVYGADEIKLMRLMAGGNLRLVERVKRAEEMWPKILQLTRSVIK